MRWREGQRGREKFKYIKWREVRFLKNGKKESNRPKSKSNDIEIADQEKNNEEQLCNEKNKKENMQKKKLLQ